jgi:hypothetical protein
MTASEGLVLAFVVNAALQATVVALAAMSRGRRRAPGPRGGAAGDLDGRAGARGRDPAEEARW